MFRFASGFVFYFKVDVWIWVWPEGLMLVEENGRQFCRRRWLIVSPEKMPSLVSKF